MAHDDAWMDPEGPSEADLERFGGSTRACPNCGSDVYDEATICPVCGEVLGEGTGSGRTPMWVIGVAVLVLAAFVLFYVL